MLENFAECSELEWLETNGPGGCTGSGLYGWYARRYYGLLMVSIVVGLNLEYSASGIIINLQHRFPKCAAFI